MKAQISVNTKGLKAIVAKFDTMEEFGTLRPLLEDAGKIAKDTASANTRSDTGKLAGSFVLDIEPFSARMHTPTPYAKFAEKGRKPGSKMPPLLLRAGGIFTQRYAGTSDLEQWARRHGIENTFMLARSLAKRGIKGRFFRRKARSAVRKEMPRLLDRMARDIEKIWGHPVSEAD